MSRRSVECPACESLIRVSDRQASRPSIFCPGCGEQVSLRESNRLVWGLVIGGVAVLFLIGVVGATAAFYFLRTSADGGKQAARVPTVGSHKPEAPGRPGNGRSPLVPQPADVVPEPRVPQPVVPVPRGNAPIPNVPRPIPPAPDADAVPVAAPDGGLQYHFKKGRDYVYRFDGKVSQGDHETILFGRCTYSRSANAADPVEAALPVSGSGTGFVVSADGYLVTCAHVVEDATTVTAELNGKTHPCRVVKVVKNRDLALLKIQAENLNPLALADSEQVQKGQDVTVFGYPFIDRLGEDLKMNSGRISGFAQRRGARVFDTDARVNPGNSGGPLVDEHGAVVGVVSAKLVGKTVTRVGFVIPTADVLEMIKPFKIEHRAEVDDVKPLSGPELNAAVSPSVALLRVTVQPRATRKTALDFSGYYHTHQSAKPGSFTTPGTDFSLPKDDRGRVVVDALGRVHDFDGNESLPYMLGQLGAYIFEPLSEDGESIWSYEKASTINRVKKSDSNRFGPGMNFGPRFGSRFGGGRFGPRNPFDPFGRREEQTTASHPATETARFTVVKHEGDLLTIQKDYEIRTNDEVNGEPIVGMTGRTTIEFDLAVGAPRLLSFKGTMTQSEQSAAVRLPVEVNCRLMTPEEVAKEQEDRLRKAEEKQARESDPKFISGKVDESLAMLAPESDSGRKISAANSLKGLQPIAERRQEVVAALKTMIEEDHDVARCNAINALAVWGGPDDVEAVIPWFDHKSPTTRWAAIEAAGKMKGDNAIDALAEKLGDRSDRNNAARALKKIGPAAEDAVIEMADHEDKFTRNEVYGVLAEIGGDKSRALLQEKSKSETDGFARGSAERNLKKLGER